MGSSPSCFVFSTRSVLASFRSCVVPKVLRSMPGADCRHLVLSLVSVHMVERYFQVVVLRRVGCPTLLLFLAVKMLNAFCSGWLSPAKAGSELDLFQPLHLFPHRSQTRDGSEPVQMLRSYFCCFRETFVQIFCECFFCFL